MFRISVFSSILVLSALHFCAVSTAAELQQGKWYSGYVTPDQGPELSLEVDHLKGTSFANVVLDFFAVPEHGCPPAFHKAFCGELVRLTASGNSSAGDTAKIIGAFAQRQDLLVAFQLPQDNKNRLLRLREMGSSANPQYNLKIYHEDRGLDFDSMIMPRQHLCEQAPCESGRLERLKDKGAKAYGVLRDLKNYMATINTNLDQRKGGAQQASGQLQIINIPEQSKPAGGKSSILQGEWEMFNSEGKSWGTLMINARNATIEGYGYLDDTAIFGRRVEVGVGQIKRAAAALHLRVTFYSGNSGERHEKDLLINEPYPGDKETRGSFRINDRFELVTLRHVGPYEGRENNSANAQVTEEPVEGDTPGIGVTGPAYSIIKVPKGKRVKLRTGPSKADGTTGSLAYNATEVLLLGCSPEIDSHTFQSAKPAERRSLLDSTWCKVLHVDGGRKVQGYLRGIYLEPIIR